MVYLTKEQVDFYNEYGYLHIKNLFSEAELVLIEKELVLIDQMDMPGTLYENDGRKRMVMGLDTATPFMKELATDPRMVGSMLDIYEEDVYLYQTKINFKHRFTLSGGQWGWHQDTFFWMTDDNMPKPIAINTSIILDNIERYNGALSLIPRTHKEQTYQFRESLAEPEDYVKMQQKEQSGNYASKKHTDWFNSIITDLADKNGIVTPLAKRGDLLIFSGAIFHASTNNGSPYNRRIVFYTYNPVSNFTPKRERVRESYYASRDFTPVKLRPTADLVEMYDEVYAQTN